MQDSKNHFLRPVTWQRNKTSLFKDTIPVRQLIFKTFPNKAGNVFRQQQPQRYLRTTPRCFHKNRGLGYMNLVSTSCKLTYDGFVQHPNVQCADGSAGACFSKVPIQKDRGFNSFACNIIKLSVNETKME